MSAAPLYTERELSDDAFALRPEVPFELILQEEREVLCRKSQGRGCSDTDSRFSLAFSGGGIRAAAFQSGVLWRLAQAGRLKDVEYLAAVSGGAYIASSFASHLLAEAPPSDTSQVDAWYLGVVAKTICRMQHNAGGFVRDLAGEAWSRPRDGSGTLPRVFDFPLLLVTLTLTLLTNPLQALIVYMVPTTEAIQLFFGGALRAAFCAPTGADQWYILWEWSSFRLLFYALEVSLVLLFAVWSISKLPIARPGKVQDERLSESRCYLMLYGMRASLTRVTAVFLILLLLLWFIPQVQIWEYTMDQATHDVNRTRHSICQRYIRSQGVAIDGSRAMGCADFHRGMPWFQDETLRNFTGQLPTNFSQQDALMRRASSDLVLRTLHRIFFGRNTSMISTFFSIFMFLMLAAIFLIPLFPSLVFTILCFAGPVAVVLSALLIIQYRVYGPLTGQSLFFDFLPFNHADWDTFLGCCLLAFLLMMPFYNDFQRLWHWYYVRSLQMNFFANGRDLSFRAVGSNPHCPLLLYTGTVSDYKHPGYDRSITEIFFSPLHTGSEVMQYVRTPHFRTLAKCTALTAAGCLDAISLSMNHHVRFRFWLELLNLSWGDYILFKRRERFASWFRSPEESASLERQLTVCFYRLPNLLVTLGIGVAFVVGWSMAKQSESQDCYAAKDLVAISACVAGTALALSFFAFLPGMGWMMFSPQFRQFQQATTFTFQSERPPELIYVTDGGVQDCTGIVQLVRRRCERILLVLAAADPNDELGVLRAAMEVASSERLASFYDLEEPRRDIRVRLEQYARDRTVAALRIGIHYGWGSSPGAAAPTGMLLVVKNRLPPVLEGQPVQPLLSEEEIVRGDFWAPRRAERPGPADDYEAWRGLATTDLGGLGCCNCCHRVGCNCGRKFPHLTGANYLWLTPQLFSSLCRLGYEVSDDAVVGI